MARWLEKAAARALRHDGVEAIVLFGSRARGDPHDESDWDVCLIGNHEPGNIEDALLPMGTETHGARVDVLWRNRADLRNDTSAGTVWAAIVRDGEVIAGDGTVLANIEVSPMKRTDIVRAFAIAAVKIRTAVHHAQEETNATEDEVPFINIEGMEASSAAAEHLSRAVVGMLGAQPGSGHNVNTDAEILNKSADDTDSAERATTLRASANAIRRTDNRTHDGRGVAYSGNAELRTHWERRVANVARTYAEVVDGAMNARGPLKGLAEGPDSERVRGIITEVARTACRTIRRINAGGIGHLAADTQDALKAWERQCSTAATAHSEHVTTN